MLDQDPTNWESKTWVLIILISSLGGFVNWIGRYKKGVQMSVMELIGELATSASVGVTTFMVLTAYGYPMLTCVAASSVSGHLATRIIFTMQLLLDTWRSQKIQEMQEKNED